MSFLFCLETLQIVIYNPDMILETSHSYIELSMSSIQFLKNNFHERSGIFNRSSVTRIINYDEKFTFSFQFFNELSM